MSFTAQMETTLDEIAAGKLNGRDYLRAFWMQVSPLFGQEVIAATLAQSAPSTPSEGDVPARKRTRRTRSRPSPRKTTAPVSTPVNSEFGICAKCGKALVKREGPRGEFLGCSSFPKCRFTRPLS